VNPIHVGFGLEQLADFPLAAGPKRHIICANRKRKHAPEQELQIVFRAPRARCQLIERVHCLGLRSITLVFDDDPEMERVIVPGLPDHGWGILNSRDQRALALCALRISSSPRSFCDDPQAHSPNDTVLLRP
jgi:hypothetical protein